MSESVFVETPEALEIIRRGGILIVTDDEERENEGDFGRPFASNHGLQRKEDPL